MSCAGTRLWEPTHRIRVDLVLVTSFDISTVMLHMAFVSCSLNSPGRTCKSVGCFSGGRSGACEVLPAGPSNHNHPAGVHRTNPEGPRGDFMGQKHSSLSVLI